MNTPATRLAKADAIAQRLADAQIDPITKSAMLDLVALVRAEIEASSFSYE
jgi:hypothetical protein